MEKLKKISGILLILFGAFSLLYIFLLYTGQFSYDPLFLTDNTIYLILFIICFIILPALTGVLGFLKVSGKLLYLLSAAELIISYIYFYFFSYNRGWILVVYDLVFIVIAILYFLAVRSLKRRQNG